MPAVLVGVGSFPAGGYGTCCSWLLDWSYVENYTVDASICHTLVVCGDTDLIFGPALAYSFGMLPSVSW